LTLILPTRESSQR